MHFEKCTFSIKYKDKNGAYPGQQRTICPNFEGLKRPWWSWSNLDPILRAHYSWKGRQGFSSSMIFVTFWFWIVQFSPSTRLEFPLLTSHPCHERSPKLNQGCRHHHHQMKFVANVEFLVVKLWLLASNSGVHEKRGKKYALEIPKIFLWDFQCIPEDTF